MTFQNDAKILVEFIHINLVTGIYSVINQAIIQDIFQLFYSLDFCTNSLYRLAFYEVKIDF